MDTLDFNGSTLFISARSPFARRVRLALLENNIQFQEKVFDVFKPEPELIEVNCLARVPVLQLKSGETLIDSHLILQMLYESIQSPLRAKSLSDRIKQYRWQAIAVGLSEKIVEFFLETLRPKEQRDPVVESELKEIFTRILSLLESCFQKEAGQYILGSQLTQADLDLGASLSYLDLRYPFDWKKTYPLTSQYLNHLNERPSFKKTVPPPAS